MYGVVTQGLTIPMWVAWPATLVAKTTDVSSVATGLP